MGVRTAEAMTISGMKAEARISGQRQKKEIQPVKTCWRLNRPSTVFVSRPVLRPQNV
jgi:hypothetical protein